VAYKIIKDPEYGFLRVDPIPSQEEVERYYREEFYSASPPHSSFNDSSLEVQQAQREFHDSRWAAICKACEQHFGRLKELSVFDIGFGYAQALLYFKSQGMEVTGLEPSPEGVEYARSQGLDVHQAGIEDFSCAGGRRFDMVTLVNVLEHLRRPADTLLNIKNSLLRPGGMLVVDVPNEFNDFQTAADAEHSLNQWWVCPPNHINYFSASTLKSTLERLGYKVIKVEATFPLEMFLLMGDVYVGNQGLGSACHEKRVAFEHVLRKHGKAEKLQAFYEALAGLDLGRQAVAYAVAPER
jgi:2-polyprenyl-3-methyl-5-hydroxy-6-metoxy-1,4-benzoquinol methylase